MRAPVYPNKAAHGWSKLVLAVVLVVAALSLWGCAADSGYVAADRLDHESVWPVFDDYLDADQGLSKEDRDIWREKKKSRLARIEQAEGGK